MSGVPHVRRALACRRLRRRLPFPLQGSFDWAQDEREKKMARFGKARAPAAKAAFVAALRRGATVAEAARAAGVAPWSLYRWRRGDAAFDAEWNRAAEASAGWEYRARPGGKARLARSKRRLRFGGARRALFLEALEQGCHTRESAGAALVHSSTVYRHLRRDPGFARDNQAALERGYARLERLAAEERAAAALRPRRRAEPPPGVRPPSGFDEQMRLLRAWRRKDGSLGPRRVGRESLKRLSFEEAMALLQRRLRGLGIIPSS